MNGLSLCTGIGGIDIAYEKAGVNPRLLRSCLRAILEADKEEDENGQFHEEV